VFFDRLVQENGNKVLAVLGVGRSEASFACKLVLFTLQSCARSNCFIA
jgi:hypothetical protein